MTLRIGVDGRNLSATGTGIATYARTLLRALADLGARAEILTAGAPRGRLRRLLAATRRGGVRSQVGDGERIARDVFRCAQVHFDLWRRPMPVTGSHLPDLMHWTAPLPLRVVGIPNIYTLHDLIPLRVPNRTDTDPRRFRRMIHAIADQADHVVTVSQTSQAEILAELPGLAGRLTVIPEAVDVPDTVTALAAPALDAIARAATGRGIGGFYLFCGAMEPRKNVPALIQAFRAAGSSRRLVLAGPDGWRSAAEIDPLLGADVIRIGFVPRETLLALMRAAHALLTPTLEEGFGLPIIEAISLGTPVLTSQGRATAEIAGDAALLVDPADPALMASAIRRLDADAALRQALQGRGLARARDFSRDAYARRLAALYTQLAPALPSGTTGL